jgi:hypothetical protein
MNLYVNILGDIKLYVNILGDINLYVNGITLKIKYWKYYIIKRCFSMQQVSDVLYPYHLIQKPTNNY